MAQLVVVVQVLVAERDADDPLHHQGLDGVLRQFRIALVAEAGGKAAGQADHPVAGAQQQSAGIRGDRAAVECSHHLMAFDRWKSEQFRDTLCRHWGVLWV
jgi:hypothetical protein